MKIEQILCGMQTADGKILSKFSPGALTLLQPKSRQKIQTLKPQDSRRVLWFPTEQVIAYPIVMEVSDKDPDHGARKGVQNQTFLFRVLEFADFYLNNGASILESKLIGEFEKLPEKLETLNV